MRAIRRLLKACLVVAAVALPAAPVPAAEPENGAVGPANWCLRLPKEDKVAYRGVVNNDVAGPGSAPMLYPAPNVAGFLAAVLTHGAIIGAVRSGEKDRNQAAADRVLLPYAVVVGVFGHRELMQRALEKTSTGGSKRLIESSDPQGDDWLVESAPVFSITQDQSAIVLENAVAVYRPGAPPAAAYGNIIKVISRARTEKDLRAFWTANEGEKLKEESVGLMAASLDVALGAAVAGTGAAENASPYKTFRYFEGGTEKMERAQLVVERCGGLVIRNLRGWLMVIPSRATDAPHC